MAHRIEMLRHGHVRLALHLLGSGEGPVLLLLHGLGESSPEALPQVLASWPGSVWGLDFTGHGRSSRPSGGGYSPEMLMADADAALAHLGPATLLGRGVGAYVALLLAGARPGPVRGVILDDGPGLAGGSASWGDYEPPVGEVPEADGDADPFALLELETDVRPPGYARLFVRQARHLAEVGEPITVVASERPEWLASVVAAPGVRTGALAEALDRYASPGNAE